MIATENEEAVLSCLLAYPEQSAPIVCAELRPEHFLATQQIIYREILGLFSEGTSFDVVSIAGRLRDKGQLEAIGGFIRLSTLSTGSAILSVLPEHIKTLKEKLAQRLLVDSLERRLAEAKSPDCDVSALLSGTLGELEEIGQARAKKKAPSMRALVQEAIGRIQAKYEKTGNQAGVSTGVPSLDKETGGALPGDQWVIAGPAKGGKSSLAATMLKSFAVDHGRRCAFFGLEMPSVENVERLVCNVGRVSAASIRDGFLTERDFPALTAAAAKLAAAPIMFRDDIFELTEMSGTIRQMKSAYPDLFAVFVDYAQLVGGNHDEKSREQEVARISRTFRKISMQEGICIILLSQVNDDGRLRESRSLGMDATKIVFIELDEKPTVRKLKLVQRNGRSGIEIRVAYIGEHFQFADLAEEPDSEPQQTTRTQTRSRFRRPFQPD